MFSILNMLFLLLFCQFSDARWDQISSLELPGGQDWGQWKDDVFCPDNSWVKGFKHKTDSNGGWTDDLGTILVEITCFNLQGGQTGSYTSNQDDWGSASTWSDYKDCSGSKNFIIGANQKVGDHSVAVTGVRMWCADRTELNPGNDFKEGSYKGYTYCPVQSAVCGIKPRFAPSEGINDDSALNNLIIHCCRTCEVDSGRYVDSSSASKDCKICHYSCKTCSGGSASNCLSCYHSAGPVSSACPTLSYSLEIETSHSPSAWTGSPSTSLSDCGDFNTGIFGGYNIFGSGAYAQKSFSSIPPHFKKRIRARFVKIDTWDGEHAKVSLDSTEIISKQFYTQDSLLVRNPCGRGDWVYDFVLEAEVADSLQSFTITISTDLDEAKDNESWGFTDFFLAILKCDSTCLSCSDQNSNSCKSCYPNAFLSSGVCSCNEQFFMKVITNCVSSPCSSCDACYTGCKRCTGAGMTDCQSCIPDYYFASGRCYHKSCPAGLCGNNATLTCDGNCAGSNQYVDTSDRICKLCDSTCLTCSEKAYTNCRSCSAPRFLSIETPNTDGQCIDPCISPRFAHYPTRRCWTACPVPSWGRTSDRVCYNDCQSTTEYKDSGDRICKSCHSSCLTCSGPLDTDCMSCGGSLYLYGGKCLADCGEGKYGAQATHACQLCNANCKSCKTPDQPNYCLSCQVNWYLKNNACINPICISSEYRDFADNTCKVCHSSCLTCFSGTANDCLTCSSPLYFYEPDHSCLSSCPSPYYAFSFDNKCYKTCPVLIATNYYGRSSTRICSTSCEFPNEFADPSDKICRPCHSECKTCDGLTNSACLNCDSPRFYKNKECLLNCGSGFYGDSPSKTCISCASPCLECKTDGPNKCTKCSSSSSAKYLDSSTEKCLQNCIAPLWGKNETNECSSQCATSHQYGDPTNRVCKECDSSCLTCDENGCTTCSAGLFLYLKTCISKCPTDIGFWGNQEKRECFNCDATCKTCSGPLSNNCESCLLPRKLLENSCVLQCPQSPLMYEDLQQIKCVGSCLEGFYPDMESQSCLKCHNSCRNCTKGSSSDCTGCVSPNVFTPSRGICSEACSKGFFRNKTSSEGYSTNCTACDHTCATCVEKKEKCTSCAIGFYPFSNAGWLCVPCNLEQQFVDPADGVCKFCNVQFCSVCKSMDLCRSCIEGYYVSASTERDFCLEKIKVGASLQDIRNPKLFKLIFSDDWDEFFENFNTTLNVSIDSIEKEGYKFLVSGAGKPMEFYLEINYSVKIPINSRMTVAMSPSFETKRSTYFMLKDKHLYAYLEEYIPCETHQYWSWEKRSCVSSRAIKPSLKSENDPNKIALEFNINAPANLIYNIDANTNITIPELTVKYKYALLTTEGDLRKVTIELDYEDEFQIKPTLFLEFKLTKELSTDESFYLEVNKVNITLPENHQLSGNSKKLVKTAAQTTEKGAQIAQVLMTAQNIINVGSLVAVKSLILMELIRYLRFVNISYPANARAVFETQFNPPDIVNIINVIPTLKLEEDPMDQQPTGLFKEYEISSYILNNSGNFLMNCVGYWLLGYCFLFISNCFKHTKQKLILMITDITRQIFVWNYVLSNFLSSYQNTILYVGVAFKWYSFQSNKGILNFVLSILTGIFALAVPMLIYKQVNKAKVFQDETEIDRRIRLASRNTRKLTQNKTRVLAIPEELAEPEMKKMKDATPLLDSESLPQRFGGKKPLFGAAQLGMGLKLDEKNGGSRNIINEHYESEKEASGHDEKLGERGLNKGNYDEINFNKNSENNEKNPSNENEKTNENNENKEDSNNLIKKRSSFVNLWEMFRKKKEQPAIEIKTTKHAARRSLINQVWERFIGKKPIVTENEKLDENPSKLTRKSFSEKFFGKSDKGKPKALLSTSPEIENLVTKTDTIDNIHKVTSPKARKSVIDRAFEFIYRTKNKKKEELQEEEGRANNPWKDGNYKTVGGEVQTVTQKTNEKTKFGRKSKGKITPWDEISYSSEIFRASVAHVGEVFKNMRAPLTIKETNERYRIFNRDLRLNKFFQRNFMAFDLLRQIIIVISLLCLEGWPFTCVSIITITNSFLFLFIIVFRPYQSLKNTVQTLVNELCLLVACAAALTLAIFDKNQEQDQLLRMDIGWMIVYSNMILIYFFMVMSLLDLAIIIRNSLRIVRKYYELKYTTGLSVYQKKKRRTSTIKKL